MKHIIRKRFCLPVATFFTMIVTLAFANFSVAANPPVALAYKSITSVLIAPPDGDTDTCPSSQVPIETSGNGNDTFGAYTFSEDVCVNSANLVFSGKFKILHANGNALFGVFNGQFIPSGQILEVHATWRVTHGTGPFLNGHGAGEGHGVSTVVNGGPGPGTIFLDGSLILPNY